MNPVEDSAVNLERALLGELLFDPTALASVADVLEPGDFFLPAHRDVYTALVAAKDECGDATDVLAVEHALVRTGAIERVGGLAFLGELHALGVTPSMARAHAKAVRAESERRRLRSIMAVVERRLRTGEADTTQGAAELRDVVTSVEQRLGTDAAGALTDLLDEFEAQAVSAASGDTTARIEPRVDPLVDAILPALSPGEMLVIGGRPKSGKSNLSGDLAYGWARSGAGGVVLSAEDAPMLWVAREACKLADVDIGVFRSGRANPVEWSSYREARTEIERLPLRVESVAGKRACDVAARMRIATGRGARFAIVDYAQLVRPSRLRKGASQSDDVSSVVDELRAEAINLRIALVLVSQLRRLPAGIREQRPSIADLRGSGMLEAQADHVLLLWRYRASDYAKCKIMLAASKHGTPREVDLEWLPHRRTFRQARDLRAVGDDGPPF